MPSANAHSQLMAKYLSKSKHRERTTLRRFYERPHLDPFANVLGYGLGIDVGDAAIGLHLPYRYFDEGFPRGDVDLLRGGGA